MKSFANTKLNAPIATITTVTYTGQRSASVLCCVFIDVSILRP
jgi:hypothetical protein